MFSPTVSELAKALSKMQGEMRNAPKDSSNPFFKSNYADLATCWDTLRPVLSKNGLSVSQVTEVLENGTTVLVTVLLHTSGEWIQGTYPLNPKDNSPQQMGSAQTYARRYALQAITGLASDDDDGHAATHGRTPVDTVRTQTANAPEKGSTHPSDAQIKRLFAIARKNNWSDSDIKDYIGKMGLEHTKDLTYIQYASLCEKIEKLPKAVHAS